MLDCLAGSLTLRAMCQARHDTSIAQTSNSRARSAEACGTHRIFAWCSTASTSAR